MGWGERGGCETKRGCRWGEARGARRNKRGRPIGRGEWGGGMTQRAADGAGREGRWRNEEGETKQVTKRAADGVGREGRMRNKEGLPMGRSERGGGETKEGSRWGGARGAAA